jgi:hypothetical protein
VTRAEPWSTMATAPITTKSTLCLWTAPARDVGAHCRGVQMRQGCVDVGNAECPVLCRLGARRCEDLGMNRFHTGQSSTCMSGVKLFFMMTPGKLYGVPFGA